MQRTWLIAAGGMLQRCTEPASLHIKPSTKTQYTQPAVLDENV